MKTVFNLSKDVLKRLKRNNELHPTILENGSWFFSYNTIANFINERPDILQKIQRQIHKPVPTEFQADIFEDLKDFEDTFLCKHCNKYPRIEAGFCMSCIDLLISKGEAMHLFSLSLSQFEVLESQNHIKSHSYKTQKRYIRTEIPQAIYQTLGTDRKWSPTRTSCYTCGRIDKPHYASGYCLECYKETLEYYTLRKFINGLNFADIGRTKGVSRERIRQLFEKAISNEAENIFGEKYSKEDLAVIREETKKENKLNGVRKLYSQELVEKRDKAVELVTTNKLTSAKSLVNKLGLTARAALILDETLPEVAEKLRANAHKWAFNHEKCVECGTTETPHRAKGLCESCYARSDYHRNAQHKWRTNNYEHYREKQIEYEKEYYKRPEVKSRIRKQSHKKRFGSNDIRDKAIERFNNKCRDCGIGRDEHMKRNGKDLFVLRIDGNPNNNEISNLAPLCMNCSAKVARQNQLSAEVN